jgi:hypothetical protein
MQAPGADLPRDPNRTDNAGNPGWPAKADKKHGMANPSRRWWRPRSQRGLVLLGSYLMAVAMGLFAWGTPVGMALLAFAYGTHVVSVTGALRQRAFPGFGGWMPTLSVSGGLGAALYVPSLTLATLVAWPGIERAAGAERWWAWGRAREGYLVDCRAYRHKGPEVGDWVWLGASPWDEDERRLGRVVGGEGQQVEWADDRTTVDSRLPPEGLALNRRGGRRADELVFRVPPGHCLVVPASGGPGRTTPGGGPMLVPRDQIFGRAWACYYPIQDRRLLR